MTDTASLKAQIAEQKKALAELEKQAKIRAKTDAKTLTDFKKFKSTFDNAEYLFRQVMMFDWSDGQYGGLPWDELTEHFWDCLACDADDDKIELLFKMLDWNEPKCERMRKWIINKRIEEAEQDF
jgi:hypothetical protein